MRLLRLADLALPMGMDIPFWQGRDGDIQDIGSARFQQYLLGKSVSSHDIS